MRNISPSLLQKINEQNQTIYNNANPHMSIVIARARSSVRDSSYFMIEKIREKEGVTDIAVSARRLQPYGSPDRIYGIHIENGIAKTSIREYPDKLKEHWKYQFDVAEAKGVSICFDGRWIQNKYKRYGLKTDETPWIFWIGADDKLYARIWDTGEIITLAENVVKIDTTRGWIPAQAGHTDDQGIIVGYIKTDGKVYYRNYCVQSTGTILWELEREITQFGIDNLGIRLFRSNDFRIGFIAEKATGNVMALTNRNWAGMSVPAEKLTANVICKIKFMPIEFSDVNTCCEYLAANVTNEFNFCPFNVTNPTVVKTERVGLNKVIVEFSDNVIRYIGEKDAFTLLAGGISYEVLGINTIDGKLEIMTADIDNALDVEIVYNSTNSHIRTYETEYCKVDIDNFEIIAEGKPPIGYITEKLTANVSADIEMIKIDFINNNSVREKLTATVSANIEFWNAEDAPV